MAAEAKCRIKEERDDFAQAWQWKPEPNAAYRERDGLAQACLWQPEPNAAFKGKEMVWCKPGNGSPNQMLHSRGKKWSGASLEMAAQTNCRILGERDDFAQAWQWQSKLNVASKGREMILRKPGYVSPSQMPTSTGREMVLCKTCCRSQGRLDREILH